MNVESFVIFPGVSESILFPVYFLFFLLSKFYWLNIKEMPKTERGGDWNLGLDMIPPFKKQSSGANFF